MKNGPFDCNDYNELQLLREEEIFRSEISCLQANGLYIFNNRSFFNLKIYSPSPLNYKKNLKLNYIIRR